MSNLIQTAPRNRLLAAARVFAEESASAKSKGAAISDPVRNRVKSRHSSLGDEMKYWKTFLGRLLLSAVRGAVCGLGISFFMFLRLGMPKDVETAGYISGLFLLAGLEFDVTVELLRSAYTLVFKKDKSEKGSSAGSPAASGRAEFQGKNSTPAEEDCAS